MQVYGMVENKQEFKKEVELSDLCYLWKLYGWLRLFQGLYLKVGLYAVKITNIFITMDCLEAERKILSTGDVNANDMWRNTANFLFKLLSIYTF